MLAYTSTTPAHLAQSLNQGYEVIGIYASYRGERVEVLDVRECIGPHTTGAPFEARTLAIVKRLNAIQPFSVQPCELYGFNFQVCTEVK